MSKSKGNVVNPDEYVNDAGRRHGARLPDVRRPWEQGGDWDDSGIAGLSRWLNRVWNLALEPYNPQSSSGNYNLLGPA